VKTILVIDDDRALLDDFRETLEDAGYSFRGASNGREAMELLERELPHLILLDLRMPDVDGWTLHVWLKNHPRLKGVPLVVISAVHVLPNMLDDMNAGGPAWIEKPVLPDQVLDVVGHHLAAG
jgi:CheY-like chemotaxis protein